MSNKLILIAEDNIVNQKVAVRQLQKLGYRADTVANGREALDALKSIPYDLVLMDCQMPEMDGYEATAEIRRRELERCEGKICGGKNRRTQIVAMTANALEGDRERCLAAGMDDYVSKPVNPEDLERVLTRLLVENKANDDDDDANDSDASQATLTLPPVDMERVHLAMGEEPEELAEILGIYFEQMSQSLEKLGAAVEAKDTDEIDLIAHNCAGVSANCGMVALVEPMRELERMGRERDIERAPFYYAQVGTEFARIKSYLQETLQLELK